MRPDELRKIILMSGNLVSVGVQPVVSAGLSADPTFRDLRDTVLKASSWSNATRKL